MRTAMTGTGSRERATPDRNRGWLVSLPADEDYRLQGSTPDYRAA